MNYKDLCGHGVNAKVHRSIIAVFVLCFVGGVACTKRPTTSPTARTAQANIDKLIQAATATPTYENFIALGLEYDSVGRTADALEMYNKAVSINPKVSIGWNNICSIYNTQKKYADAIPNCEKAIALDANFTLAQNNLKLAKDKLAEQRKMVVERNKNWTAQANLTAQDLINIGMDFYAVRELEASTEAWARVKQSDPLYATAQNNLASSFILLGKFSSAEKSLAEALKLEPKNELFANNKLWLERAKSEKK